MNFAANFNDPDYKIYIAYIYGDGKLLKEYRFDGNVQILDLTRNGKFSYVSLFNLIRIIKKEKIDLVHTHLVHAGILGKIAAKFAGVKHVVSTRHYGFHHNENRFLYKIEDLLTKSASVVIAISNSVRKTLLTKGLHSEEKIVVIPNAIDLKRINFQNINPENNRGSRYAMGSVGRLDPQKDFITLLDCTRIVANKLPDIRLEIIGDGILQTELVKYIDKMELRKNVTLEGKLPNHVVLKRMCEWDLFVLSSAWEGFGIALLEAMALEKAVVATRVEGVVEVVDDGVTGYLVPPRTPEALAARIIELLADEEKRREMGKRGREKTEQQFSIEKYIAQTKKIYDSLLQENQSYS